MLGQPYATIWVMWLEHTIRRVRIFQAVTQVNRHGRRKHEDRVRAVAGLVNRLNNARPNS